MTTQSVDISTTVSVEDAAAFFRKDMRVIWFGENITGIGTVFTETDGLPVGLRRADAPDLALTAELAGRAGNAGRSTIHMLIWDQGARRRIQLGADGTVRALHILANRKIRRFVVSLQEEDPSLTYTGI